MNIKFLENNKYFKKQTLKKWELLFDEWDFDDNLYIILSWELKIEKYISDDRKETKLIAILKNNEIFWEASLSNKQAKEVKIVAKKETKLLKIKSEDFEEFMSKFPKLWIEILTSIIDLSNKRLREANLLLTTSYNISKIIWEKQDFDNKNLFKIIDNILEILDLEYILVFEKNQVLENYIKFEYDTRNKWKMQNEIFELNWEMNLEFLEKNNIKINKNIFIQKLINQNKNIWYLVFAWDLSETLKKNINSISIMIASFIKQKQYFENEKNKEK